LPVYIHIRSPILVNLSKYKTKWRYFFLEVSFLPFQVLSFSKSDCFDFIAAGEWPSIHLAFIHWIEIWGQCWSLKTSCSRRQKQFPSLKMHTS